MNDPLAAVAEAMGWTHLGGSCLSGDSCREAWMTSDGAITDDPAVDDMLSWLNGQPTCDVEKIESDNAITGGWQVVLWRDPGDYSYHRSQTLLSALALAVLDVAGVCWSERHRTDEGTEMARQAAALIGTGPKALNNAESSAPTPPPE